MQHALRGPDPLTLYDPTELPELYAAIERGTCMEPEFQDGDCIAFSKSAAPVPGDIVCIWFRPGLRAPGEPQQWLKRLVIGPPPEMTFPFTPHQVSEVLPCIMVEQLNPPKQYRIKCSDILAIHKCIGEAEPAENGKARFRWKDARP